MYFLTFFKMEKNARMTSKLYSNMINSHSFMLNSSQISNYFLTY